MSQSDNLNIESHTQQLILKALNRTDSVAKAAKLLGISIRGLYLKLEQYNIKQEWVVKK